MAKYFRFFPKTPYFLEETGDLDLVTNIITRIKFLEEIKNIGTGYFVYDIQNGDTPESLAYKFYGSVEKHWIILLLNDIVDPVFDWYKDYLIVNKYIDEKYSSLGGIAYAQSNIYKYIITERRVISGFGEPTEVVETRETDRVTYESIPETITTKVLTNSGNYIMTTYVEKSTQSYYDYEVEENENKKSVKILNKEYVPEVERELKSLLGAI